MERSPGPAGGAHRHRPPPSYVAPGNARARQRQPATHGGQHLQARDTARRRGRGSGGKHHPQATPRPSRWPLGPRCPCRTPPLAIEGAAGAKWSPRVSLNVTGTDEQRTRRPHVRADSAETARDPPRHLRDHPRPRNGRRRHLPRSTTHVGGDTPRHGAVSPASSGRPPTPSLSPPPSPLPGAHVDQHGTAAARARPRTSREAAPTPSPVVRHAASCRRHCRGRSRWLLFPCACSLRRIPRVLCTVDIK